MNTKRNNKIEMLRFLFAIAILLFHCNTNLGGHVMVTQKISLFEHGKIGVEFFYLVTGFLLAKSVEKSKSLNTNIKNIDNIGISTFDYVIKKIKPILPYHFLFCGFIVLVRIINKNINIAFLAKSFPSLLFLQSTGIMGNNPSFLQVEWYISSMLIAILILYPLCICLGEYFYRVVAPVSGLLIISYIITTKQYLPGDTLQWSGVVLTSNLRAIADISLGTFCFSCSNILASKKYTKLEKVLFSLIELLCYAIILIYMISTISALYQGVMVVVFVIAVILSFSNVGLLSNTILFQNRICEFLGKFSLPIYLAQNIALYISYAMMQDYSKKERCTFIVLFDLILAFISYFMVNLVKKIINKKEQ